MSLKHGLVHYYYGYGKGKTTAAMGLALRAIGSGLRVLIVQFLKNGTSSEVAMLRQTGARILALESLRGFTIGMTGEELAACAAEHNLNLETAAAVAAEGGCDLLVLDEIGDALELNLVNRERLAALLAGRAPQVEIVMTGHKPDEMLQNSADYVTQMKKEKHPYECGIRARKGIEF